MKKILEVKNLTKYYGDVLAVKDLSFSLNEGEVFGFIGPNGAGKSTTIRAIMNLINKNEGTVLVVGKEFRKDDKTIKEQIGYLPSEIHLYDDFTVKEMLDYHESFYQKDFHKRRVELVKRLKLDERKRIEDLSLGNLKKLGIVLALMHEPRLLILDEPTSGLDPFMQENFFDLLKEEKQKGTTILYSTHILSEISKICDRVGMIKNGHLLKVETMKEIHQKNFNFVTIESREVDKVISLLKEEVIKKEGNLVKIKNTLSANRLIKLLGSCQLEKILIEEATLEEVFFHDYQ